ncbi:4Fe-4S binding protein [Cetobacterium somerae]|uniref:ATP-binding protein n=1 Tax=Cetobacterium somerae TaxID=188913 RepID=UPI00211E2207|nr:4Fe-4S binding protein [Cetobacterium somerae]MCQ9628077.1 4Fe-4S binding protein [Cetobacterium somerae]
MAKIIIDEHCIGCGTCEKTCIVGCISQIKNKKRFINPDACVDCGACQLVCPSKCIIS